MCRRPSGSVSCAVAEAAARPAGTGGGGGRLLGRAALFQHGNNSFGKRTNHKEFSRRLASSCSSITSGGGGSGAGGSCRQHRPDAAGERQQGAKGRGGAGKLLRLQTGAVETCKCHWWAQAGSSGCQPAAAAWREVGRFSMAIVYKAKAKPDQRRGLHSTLSSRSTFSPSSKPCRT